MLNNFLLLLYFIFNVSLVVYNVGFFPSDDLQSTPDMKPVLKGNQGEVKKEPRLVLMIVDAMRTDFIDSPMHHYHMPFLQSKLTNNHACLLKVKTSAPTVTLPRIKAITSGKIPNYLDVILNLGSSEFTEDTFIKQAYLHDRTIVFYGDDTWLKMFPKYFHRSGGTHSFYAADFWEVDANVTEGVNVELRRDDWDIMILHYLGLDHIGHMQGPLSGFIPRKLLEMDNVIRNIHESLENLGSESLFLVTGDHGMKDSGGHGGVTSSEIYVPLVSLGHPCHRLDGWPDEESYTPDQTDLAATISVFLNLPVPADSTGKLIPALLGGLEPSLLFGKLNEVHEMLEGKAGKEDENEHPHSREISLGALLYHNLTTLSEKLNRSRTSMNLSYMISACITMWILLLTFLFLLQKNRPSNALHVFHLVATIAHTLTLGATSFIEEEHQTWYFLWVTFVLLCIRERWRRKIIVKSYVLDVKLVHLLLLVASHRWLRKLNQTGDKWANIPDWDDFFRDNQTVLLLFFLAALGWLCRMFAAANHRRLDRMLFAAGIISIVFYRVSISSFSTVLTNFPKSRGTWPAGAFYLTAIAFLYKSVIYGETHVSWLWALLSALTLRSHNVIIIPAIIFTSQQLNSVFSRDGTTLWNTMAHIWMGNVFYFYQGHSNSLANIDVAPAFLGCWNYNPVYGGIMTIIHTYASPILSFLLSPKNYSAVLFSRMLPMTFYCTLTAFQRHHLFVWSVFSPKLLLESSLTLVLFLVMCAHKGCTVIKNYK